MKKKIFKSLAVVACALLLVVGSVVGTFAYLTSKATVTNTFTVGNVKITMDEAVVDVYGDETSGRTDEGNKYKLLPGHTYVKDPTIYVDANSEVCWIFVKIENGLADIESAGENGTVVEQMVANGWNLVDGETDVYAYNAKQSGGAELTPFEDFTISGTADVNVDADRDGTADYAEKEIVVTAYAVQADGFTTAQAAWDATFGA